MRLETFLNICNSLKNTSNDLLFEKEPCEYDEGNIKDRIEMCSEKEKNSGLNQISEQ